MDKKSVLAIYKLPLLISFTVFIVILGVKVLKEPYAIGLTFAGALLGTFILDLEYFIYAFLLEPEKEFSKSLVAYVAHKDLGNALRFIEFHKDEVREKSLNSAIFQVVLIPLALFTVSSAASIFVKALVLSLLANSILKLVEHFFQGKLAEWFWTFKNVPTKQGALVFIALLLLTFLFSLKLL